MPGHHHHISSSNHSNHRQHYANATSNHSSSHHHSRHYHMAGGIFTVDPDVTVRVAIPPGLGTVAPGGTVVGQVVVTVGRDTEVEGVILQYHCTMAQVLLTNDAKKVASRHDPSSTNTARQELSDRHHFYDLRVLLFGSSGVVGGSKTLLRAGVYSYPFALSVPAALPPTIDFSDLALRPWCWDCCGDGCSSVECITVRHAICAGVLGRTKVGEQPPPDVCFRVAGRPFDAVRDCRVEPVVVSQVSTPASCGSFLCDCVAYNLCALAPHRMNFELQAPSPILYLDEDPTATAAVPFEVSGELPDESVVCFVRTVALSREVSFSLIRDGIRVFAVSAPLHPMRRGDPPQRGVVSLKASCPRPRTPPRGGREIVC